MQGTGGLPLQGEQQEGGGPGGHRDVLHDVAHDELAYVVFKHGRGAGTEQEAELLRD